MAAASDDDVRRRNRLLIIVAVVLAVGIASFCWTQWIDNSLDSDVREATLEIEEFFGVDASDWHARVANALIFGPSSDREDDWERLKAAQALGNADTVQVALSSGPDSDITLVYRLVRFGTKRCLTVTIDSAGSNSAEEQSC